MRYTDEELIEDIQKIADLIANCDYGNPFLCKISQKKVIKAYSALCDLQKKIRAKRKTDLKEKLSKEQYDSLLDTFEQIIEAKEKNG